MTPKITSIRQDDTHRLIPTRFSDERVLRRLTDGERQLQDLFELHGATDDRLLGEASLLPGISSHELVFGVAHADIVNAAFTHVHPSGGRFSGPERGAWYAAFELETAQSEIAFHKAREIEEIHWPEPETFTFRDYLADFRADFHDIRGDRHYRDCLDPGRYLHSQRLARRLLAKGSAGIVYPSVRCSRGACIACFRPALVANVRPGRLVTVTFRDAGSQPEIT